MKNKQPDNTSLSLLQLYEIIPAETIKTGQISIFLDTSSDIEKNVKRYNDIMFERRCSIKLMKKLKNIIIYSTPLAYFVILVYGLIIKPLENMFVDGRVFWSNSLFIFIMAASALAYFFGIWKDDLRVVALSGVAFPLIHLVALLISVMNIVLYAVYQHIDKPLKTEKEYPLFAPIIIHYEKFNTPRGRL